MTTKQPSKTQSQQCDTDMTSPFGRDFSLVRTLLEIDDLIRPVPGHSLYYVTRDGRVHSARNNRFLRPWTDRKGYLRYYLYSPGKPRKGIMAHRLVAAAYLQNPKNLPQLNHLDGDKTNNHPSNLRWSTPRDNIRHAIKLGLRKVCVFSKLTETDVIEIRQALDAGVSLKEIAEKYGVTQQTVSSIKCRRIWKHVPDPAE